VPRPLPIGTPIPCVIGLHDARAVLLIEIGDQFGQWRNIATHAKK
jgi:hypothetical protein